MTENRLTSAIDRLDKAVARIENAKIGAGTGQEVEKKYEQLKSEVRLAVAEMDKILDRGPGHG